MLDNQIKPPCPVIAGAEPGGHRDAGAVHERRRALP